MTQNQTVTEERSKFRLTLKHQSYGSNNMTYPINYGGCLPQSVGEDKAILWLEDWDQTYWRWHSSGFGRWQVTIHQMEKTKLQRDRQTLQIENSSSSTHVHQTDCRATSQLYTS